jgi:hypothetical protein
MERFSSAERIVTNVRVATENTAPAGSPERTVTAVDKIVTRRQTVRAPLVTGAAPIVSQVQPFARRMQMRLQSPTLDHRPDAASSPATRVLTSATVEHVRAHSRIAPVGSTATRTHVAASRQGTEAAAGTLNGETGRQPLYSQPVPRRFTAQPQPAPVAPTVVTAPVTPPPPASPPPIDVARLTEDVYHHLQRRIRIERERRGL